MMPGLVTVPPPLPAVVTVGGKIAKVAVTVRAALIVTTHAAVPVQAPPQATNPEPGVGVAVSVTSVPAAYWPAGPGSWCPRP